MDSDLGSLYQIGVACAIGYSAVQLAHWWSSRSAQNATATKVQFDSIYHNLRSLGLSKSDALHIASTAVEPGEDYFTEKWWERAYAPALSNPRLRDTVKSVIIKSKQLRDAKAKKPSKMTANPHQVGHKALSRTEKKDYKDKVAPLTITVNGADVPLTTAQTSHLYAKWASNMQY